MNREGGFDAALSGHHDIHQNDVRTQASNDLNRLFAVRSLADDFNFRTLKCVPQHFTDERGVIHND
jgi:hypothetical protein